MWKFLIILILSLIWALKASEELSQEKGYSKTGACNTTIDGNSSAINLNIHDISNKRCYWNLTSTNFTAAISLFFNEVYLHEDDELNIYRNYSDAVNNINALTEKPIRSQNGTLTIITNETYITIALVGSGVHYNRVFEGYFIVKDCLIPVPPEVEILNSPVYLNEDTDSKKCVFRFNEIAHERVIQVFSFEIFNMTLSHVEIEGGTSDGTYTNVPPTDFFIDEKVLLLTVQQALNSTDNFKLKIHNVDKDCSGAISVDDTHQLISPPYVLNNGSIESECRWIVTSSKAKILGMKFDKLDFLSVFDLAAVNDGLSEFSRPLLQVTTSNRNTTQNQMIRASSSTLWVSFKPLSYKSSFVANITIHGQGGYFKNSGDLRMVPTTGDDTIFLLEVDDGKIVELDTRTSTLSPPATLSVYDGFDTSSLLTSLSGPVKFPILSRSSKMMVIGTNFSAEANSFDASFKGIVPGCNHMSSMETESYILSENCNSTCKWIIPPQNSPSSVLVVNLQYISLQKGDNIKIHKLDNELTELGEINADASYVPRINLPANVGALISVTQADCKKGKDKVVLIGHSSYIPGCDQNIMAKTSDSLQLSSPLYPDTYPVFANCLWNITAPKGALVHIALETLNLADNHCIKVSTNESKNKEYEGKALPSEDLFLFGDVVVEFDSSGCNKSAVGKTLKSDLGFLLNLTVTDCGGVLENKMTGVFNTSITGNNSICIWKVVAPVPKNNSVNILRYVMKKTDALENYELHVYDGATVRDSKIENDTAAAEIWSRTDTLIFVYHRLDSSKPSSVLEFNYNAFSCNAPMLCDNKICMHPDWRCNGHNDCGDFSDEKDCSPVPPTNPTPIQYAGYSATAFWLCIFAMLFLGVVLGLGAPICYQKYQDSRARRFHELES